MEIKRDLYLNKLIRSKHNGMIKVITKIRRCFHLDITPFISNYIVSKRQNCDSCRSFGGIVLFIVTLQTGHQAQLHY